MDAGILPVKRLADAKERLARHFPDDQRIAIARALFHDALDLMASVEDLEWWVVSSDDEVLSVATERGFATIVEAESGLNAALEQSVEVMTEAGATSVTIIPSDVPLAWAGDLRDLLDTGATSEAVVVPADSDGGTNALYLSPPDVMAPRFGRASLKAHIVQAEQLKLRCSMLALPRLGLDIDRLADIQEFLKRARPEGRSYEVLSKLMADYGPEADVS